MKCVPYRVYDGPKALPNDAGIGSVFLADFGIGSSISLRLPQGGLFMSNFCMEGDCGFVLSLNII